MTVSTTDNIHTKKRIFDLIVTLAGAIFWLPVLGGCGLAILLLDGAPVFYTSQRRVNSKVIPVTKFRTMVRDAASRFNRETVPVSNNVRFLNTPPDSPLYTPIGRLIERCSFTELPQLLQVMRGELSLVGNRPLPENVVQSLRQAYPEIDRRFQITGGMTGPVQLVGRAELSDEQRLRLEYAYCDQVKHRYTWRLDFMILLSTVLIYSGWKKPLSVAEVLDLMERCKT